MTFKLQIQTGVNWTVHDAAEEAIKVRRYGINNPKLIKNVFFLRILVSNMSFLSDDVFLTTCCILFK